MWTGDRAVEDSAAFVAVRANALWRHRWFLLLWIGLWIGAGLGYAALVKPQFIARVDILLEPRHIAEDGPEALRRYHQIALDGEQAETQLRVLRSERLLRPIFEQLRLSGAPELAEGHDGVWSMVAHALHRFAPRATPYDSETRAYFAFADRVRCLRLGLSYVIELSYRSRDPVQAAEVVNAIAAAYVGDRLTRMRAGMQRAGGPYRVARAEALAGEMALAREAASRGAALADATPHADVRLLGPAVPPLTKSYPKLVPTVLFTAGSGALSGMFGVIFLAPAFAGARARSRPRSAAGEPIYSLPG